jgi:alpha-glucosidase (family GH31 glycosyl hydrolase)
VKLNDDVELMAEFWNQLDAALGKKRARKWKAASVIERLIEVGVDGFWAQIGGRPDTKEAREAAVSRVVAQARQKPKK